eukprot:CAMPEP_0197864846 /NCGR_PEP_ID=MMETSP1438-20131217/43323_1 /TAXON_ID=1461541 /ORGANISM="Pterosperma sp., Strain CCMP1384" /LENGTH=408 /DNA_ID=CAMNT_0043483219 /DNA_START=756 /DNA_END=1978 /DNA_ORIENTATION=-
MAANTNPLSDGWTPTQYSIRNLKTQLDAVPEWTLEQAVSVIDKLIPRLNTARTIQPWQLTIVWPRRNDGTLIDDDDPSFGEEIYVPIELWVTQGTSHTDWIQQLCVHPWFGDNLNQTYGEPLASVVGALSVSDSVLALGNHTIDGKGVRVVGVRIVGTNHTTYPLDSNQQIFGRLVRDWQGITNSPATSVQLGYSMQIPATTIAQPGHESVTAQLNTSQLETPAMSPVAAAIHQFEMLAATQGTPYVPTNQGTSYVPTTQGASYVPTAQSIPYVPASTQVTHHVLSVPQVTATQPNLIGAMPYVQQGIPMTTPPMQGRSIHSAPVGTHRTRNPQRSYRAPHVTPVRAHMTGSSQGAIPAPDVPSIPLMQAGNSQEVNPTPSVQSMRTVSQNMGHPEATMCVPAGQAAS